MGKAFLWLLRIALQTFITTVVGSYAKRVAG